MTTCLIAILLLASVSLSFADVDHGTLCPGAMKTVVPSVLSGAVIKPPVWEVFTFAGLAGQVIDIAVRRTKPAMDPVMLLIGPSGKELARQDDDVEDCCGGPFGDPQLSNFMLPETGVYKIQVAGNLDSLTGDREFTILLQGASTFFFEFQHVKKKNNPRGKKNRDPPKQMTTINQH